MCYDALSFEFLCVFLLRRFITGSVCSLQFLFVGISILRCFRHSLTIAFFDIFIPVRYVFFLDSSILIYFNCYAFHSRGFLLSHFRSKVFSFLGVYVLRCFCFSTFLFLGVQVLRCFRSYDFSQLFLFLDDVSAVRRYLSRTFQLSDDFVLIR